jgi:hypothetical protein
MRAGAGHGFPRTVSSQADSRYHDVLDMGWKVHLNARIGSKLFMRNAFFMLDGFGYVTGAFLFSALDMNPLCARHYCSRSCLCLLSMSA